MLQPSGNTLNPLFSRASPCSENTFRIQLPVYHLGFLDRPCSFDIPRQDHTYTRLRFSFGGLQPGIYSCMEADQALHFITSLPELNGAALSKVQLAWAFDTTHCLTTDPVASHSPLLLFALCSLLSSLSSLLPALCSLLSALCSLCSLRSLPSPLCSLPFPSALSPLLSALCSLLSALSFLLSPLTVSAAFPLPFRLVDFHHPHWARRPAQPRCCCCHATHFQLGSGSWFRQSELQLGR